MRYVWMCHKCYIQKYTFSEERECVADYRKTFHKMDFGKRI